MKKTNRAPAKATRAQPKRAETAAKKPDSDVDPAVGSAADGESDASEDWAASEPRLVRLNKFLADNGVASRRRCDELIAARKVFVDGESVNEMGMKIDPERQEVEVDGFKFKARSARKRYYLLNKPSGVVCTNESRETRPRAVDLITDPFKGRIYTVGRLDEESKGLIILTNDGEFAHRIQHPKYGIEKTYLVKVAGEINDTTLKEIREGVHLSEGRTAGSRIVVHDRGRDYSLLSISIREGMNREIRRVFAQFGFKVTELKRIRVGTLTDRGLKPGRWRELLPGEIAALRAGDNEMRAEEHSAPEGKKRPMTRGRNGAQRVRGSAPFTKPKKRGYARHLVQGGRAVERRPDAPQSFRERERESEASQSAPIGRGGKIYGRTSSRPITRPSAPKSKPARLGFKPAKATAKPGAKPARPGAAARPGATRPKQGNTRGGMQNRAPKPKVGRKNR